jgi:hypothetical protein
VVSTNSCCKCLFLFTRDYGYSNYTVEGSELYCAMEKNDNLPAEIPETWGPKEWVGIDGDPEKDNWTLTNQSRCEHYQEYNPEFQRVRLDVDLEDLPGEEAAKEAFMQGDVMPLMVRRLYYEK